MTTSGNAVRVANAALAFLNDLDATLAVSAQSRTRAAVDRVLMTATPGITGDTMKATAAQIRTDLDITEPYTGCDCDRQEHEDDGFGNYHPTQVGGVWWQPDTMLAKSYTLVGRYKHPQM